jgi:hypothetical protein
MGLRMMACGLLAGLGVLAVLAVLESWCARPGGAHVNAGAGEGDVTAQVWQVLAEARRITEEA